MSTILDSPSADPHAYEPTTHDADAIAAADVVVENGLGYDAFAEKLLAASPRDGRTVLVAGTLAGRMVGDNPHVWYDVMTLRRVAGALAGTLESRKPARRAAIDAARARFDTWLTAFAARERRARGVANGAAVAITEPVFDDVLGAIRRADRDAAVVLARDRRGKRPFTARRRCDDRAATGPQGPRLRLQSADRRTEHDALARRRARRGCARRIGHGNVAGRNEPPDVARR